MLRNTKDGAVGWGSGRKPHTVETMLNTLRYENHMVRTGGKKGFLKAKTGYRCDPTTKNSWRICGGNDSEESVVVLNDGIEFQDASQTAVESQLNENNKPPMITRFLRFSTLSPLFWRALLPRI